MWLWLIAGWSSADLGLRIADLEGRADLAIAFAAPALAPRGAISAPSAGTGAERPAEDAGVAGVADVSRAQEPGEAGGLRHLELGLLEELDARALRRLPGLGVQRAFDVARARWSGLEGAEPLSEGAARRPLGLEDIPGIGPITVERVRAALAGPPVGDPAAPESGGEPAPFASD